MTSEPVRLLLMTDYAADPLWMRTSDGKGRGMVPLATLPLSPQLRRRLRAWAAAYEALLAPDYRWPSPAAYAEFVDEGRRLLVLVREELGAGYDVQYFEEPLQ